MATTKKPPAKKTASKTKHRPTMISMLAGGPANVDYGRRKVNYNGRTAKRKTAR